MSNNPIKDCLLKSVLSVTKVSYQSQKIYLASKGIVSPLFLCFYPQSNDVRTICREVEHVVKYVVFGFPTKNHPQTSVLKLEKPSENNRSQCLSKNNRTDCDGKNVQKPSTSHRCCLKNIGIALLSKIDHRSSL